MAFDVNYYMDPSHFQASIPQSDPQDFKPFNPVGPGVSVVPEGSTPSTSTPNGSFNILDPSTWFAPVLKGLNPVESVAGAITGEAQKAFMGAALYGLLFLGVLGLILPSQNSQGINLTGIDSDKPKGKAAEGGTESEVAEVAAL